MFPKKRKNAHILLKSQLSAQECWKCKIVRRKSAQRNRDRPNQGRIQKIQKEEAEETDDAVLHHSGCICDQTLGLTLRTFQKYREKGGGGGPLAPPPLNPHMLIPKQTRNYFRQSIDTIKLLLY